MGPPQGRAEGKENLPRPAAHTPPNHRMVGVGRDLCGSSSPPQDPIGLLGTQGTLLAHGHPVTCDPAATKEALKVCCERAAVEMLMYYALKHGQQ